MRHLTLITTGGTIEKTYDEQTGSLDNRRSIVRRMLRRLRIEEASISIVELMSKDSLVMTDDDRRRIVEVVRGVAGAGAISQPSSGGTQSPVGTPMNEGVVILHGTDTLELTGNALLAAMPNPAVPIILTGAMRPYEMVRSDALQNLTEAIFAAGVMSPGVYCVAHGRAMRFPGVHKDRERGTFIGGAD